MPTKEELDRRHLTDLAAQCRRVAKSRSANSVIADKAWGLTQEWESLPKPRNPVLEELKKIEAQQKSLKKRIVEFLADVL